MDQKLQNLLYSLPARTAWIIVGSCAVFWLICLTGVLTPPVSAPPNLTLFWFYTMLMLVLASGLAVIGAGAVLVLKRGGRAGPGEKIPVTAALAPVPTAAPAPGAAPGPAAPAAAEPVAAEPGQAPVGAPAEADDGGPDQLAGLSRMLDDPGNLAGTPEIPPATAAAAPKAASPPPRAPKARSAVKRKRRKRR